MLLSNTPVWCLFKRASRVKTSARSSSLVRPSRRPQFGFRLTGFRRRSCHCRRSSSSDYVIVEAPSPASSPLLDSPSRVLHRAPVTVPGGSPNHCRPFRPKNRLLPPLSISLLVILPHLPVRITSRSKSSSLLPSQHLSVTMLCHRRQPSSPPPSVDVPPSPSFSGRPKLPFVFPSSSPFPCSSSFPSSVVVSP